MKKIILLFSITLILSCSKDDSATVTATVPELSIEQEVILKTENEKKLIGKWNFNSLSGRVLETCEINSIEFSEENTFILKLNITGGTSNVEYVQGHYYIIFAEATVDDVPIERIILFNAPVTDENSIPESGNVATFTNIVFDAQGDVSFTFQAESEINNFCATAPQNLSAEQAEQIVVVESVLPDSNQALLINTWRITGNSESINGQATDYTICDWFADSTEDLCYSSELNNIDPNCSFISDPINDIVVSITAYGTYFMTFSNSSGPVDYEEGEWNWVGDGFNKISITFEENGQQETDILQINSVSSGSLVLSASGTDSIDGVDVSLEETYTMQPASDNFTNPSCPEFSFDTDSGN